MKINSAHKIMIVEDEAAIALRLQQILTSMGYNVTAISYSGEEALETAKNLKPDLILMDIMIPGEIDGIALAEIVKSELDIPVIFLTSYSETHIIERAKLVEPYGYIVKPYQDRELKAAIDVALYKKERQRKRRESEIQLRKSYDELKHLVENSTKELNIKTKNLEELNTALKVLLDKREEDKSVIEEKIMCNINALVTPYLDKLKKVSSVQSQKTMINILEANLNGLISSFSYRLSSKYLNLTPSEIKVANMVKLGKTNKEIAEILHLSSRTVSFHRENIRKKLGLTNRKKNLKTYLMSLD